MDELLKKVLKEVDIPEEAARKVIEIVLGFLKTKLPGPIAGQLDDLLAGKITSIVGGGGGGLAGLLGGLFGKKK